MAHRTFALLSWLTILAAAGCGDSESMPVTDAPGGDGSTEDPAGVEAVEAKEETDESGLTSEEYLILSAALADYVPGDEQEGLSVLEEDTMDPELVESDLTEEWFEGLRREEYSESENGAIDDLLEKNKQSARLSDRLDEGLSYQLVSREKIDPILAECYKFSFTHSSDWSMSSTESWKPFYSAFPGANGLLCVSRPGIDSSGNAAAVFVSCYRGDLHAEGRILLLAKEDGKWRIAFAVRLWVS
ncbi:MAG: hypothetical protein HQ581_29180 [Planctomycetes bacterium]|nr:hypothetical protein [Planctomycetota bacterium]